MYSPRNHRHYHLHLILPLLLFSLVSLSTPQHLPTAYTENHLLLLPSIRKSRRLDSIYCQSWRFSVETNDAGKWSTVPSRCIQFVTQYMTGQGYSSDSEMVAGNSLEFAHSVQIAADEKDAWIFDIDDTLFSNWPYYQARGFGDNWKISTRNIWSVCGMSLANFLKGEGAYRYCGKAAGKFYFLMFRKMLKEDFLSLAPFFPIHGLRSKVFDEESFDEWVKQAEAPALPASLSLYKELQQLGFKLFLLTGRSEPSRNATVENLRLAGYDNWERLILRGPSDKGKLAIDFKSEKRKELEDEGYRIHGNSGDQWSDLLGYAISQRSFKHPNPMYHIA